MSVESRAADGAVVHRLDSTCSVNCHEISVTELEQKPHRSLFSSKRAFYPVTSPFTNSSMRPRRARSCGKKLTFAVTTLAFVVVVAVIYVFVTLPTQGVINLQLVESLRGPKARTAEPLLLSPFGLGYYDVRGAYKWFSGRREKTRNHELSYPSEHPEQAYISYVRLVTGLRELSNFVVASEKAIGRDDPERWPVLAHIHRYTRSLESTADKLVLTSGAEAKARQTVSDSRERLWTALEQLQNPADCSEVRALRCRLTNPNGFASSIHDVLHCLVSGLQMNLTVILDTSAWHYTKTVGWNDFLKPLSKCDSAGSVIDGYPQPWDIERIHMTHLPAGIGAGVMASHGNPMAWFHGILMSYILRPNEKFGQKLADHVASLKQPYVGMHIRRTDKKFEALLRSTVEYVAEAERFFEKTVLQENVENKFVYVATDEPRVVEELQSGKFATFEFICNEDAVQRAHEPSTRSKNNALEGILKDLWALSRSSHLVCTLSSGFCRVAYELMQTVHWDAWRRIFSLDNTYFYAYALEPERELLEPDEDVIFASETARYKLMETRTYSNAVERWMHVSKEGMYPDGFSWTNDLQARHPRFKTEQPLQLVRYEAEI